MNKRVYYFDYLKLLAIFGVILIHLISKNWYLLDITSTNFKVYTLIDSITRFCVPIFFMISGSLLLDDKYKIDNKFYKKILKLLLLYILFYFIYYFSKVIVYDKGVITLDTIFTIFKDIIVGKTLYHLWFLPAIIGFYLLVPILKYIIKKSNKKIIVYMLILLFINIMFTNRGIKNYYLIVSSYYLFYPILGYYLHNYKTSKNKQSIIYFIGTISLLFTFLKTLEQTYLLQVPNEYYFNYYSLNVMLYSINIFILFKYNFNKPFLTKIIKFLTNNFLGIYLVHGLVIGLLKYLSIYSINLNYIYLLPLSLLVFIISLFISFIIKYIIKKIRRMFYGRTS